MKIILFFLSVICFIPSFSQDYKPLLDNFNEWHLTTCYSGCLTDVYYTDSDTIVNGFNYKILDGYHFISRKFLLREDVEEKKVYLNFVEFSINEEYLLYDFSLNVGDSIDIKNPISPFPEDGGYYKVDSILYEELEDGNDYRHFYLSPTASNTISSTPAIWIEGVGSLSQINAPGGFPDVNGGGHLSCFFKNGELFYSNSHSTSECEPILDIRFPNSSLGAITLNTVITKGECRMYHTENVNTVEVYDFYGRKIIDFKSDGQPIISIDFSNFSTGLYFILAKTADLEKKIFKVIVK